MGLTKFKQKLQEMFSKKNKTVDEALERKMCELEEFEHNVITYKKNIECFIQNAMAISERHAALGNTFRVVYQDSPYEDTANEIAATLRDIEGLKSRTEAITKEIAKLATETAKEMTGIREQKKIREERRLFFDHYRVKVKNLAKGSNTATDPKKQEKYIRN